nr:immunoglobulin heavy chain junction region [Macaca mulatta]MOX66768.1 immunoglobulin heavy chain junction region [Macaca mulatta]
CARGPNYEDDNGYQTAFDSW